VVSRIDGAKKGPVLGVMRPATDVTIHLEVLCFKMKVMGSSLEMEGVKAKALGAR
jgi:hypothetical protein